MPTPFRVEEGNTAAALTRVVVRSCIVLEPAHAEKQHAREPGDLLGVLVEGSRPAREGHKPKCGRERSGEVGLRRSTAEPLEQGGVTFRGGRGGKGADRGKHRSITCFRHRAEPEPLNSLTSPARLWWYTARDKRPSVET